MSVSAYTAGEAASCGFPLASSSQERNRLAEKFPWPQKICHLVSALSSFEAQGVKAPDSENGERVERQNRNRPEAAEGGVCVAQQAHQRSGTCANSDNNFKFKFRFTRDIRSLSMEGK